MLRVFQSTTASDAKKYFTESLSQQDYYTRDQSVVATWGGVAGQRLRLTGPVHQKAFAALCDNTHPATGQRLTPRTRDDRTVGYDLSFHAPKGVSVLQALTGDDRITEAFQEAARATMAEIEAGVHTRVRLGGRSEDRHTGNLVWGEFTHYTTRPVGGEPDPQLHVHCYVFNATWDETEARWKAGQFRPVVRDHPYYQAAFHTRLAHNLELIGYEIARNRDAWDLKDFLPETAKKYSRRTEQIEQAAKRLGITDPAEKGELGARTRAGKAETLTGGELARRWQQRLTEDEAERVHRIAQGPGLKQDRLATGLATELATGLATGLATNPAPRDPLITAAKSIDHALTHTFERKSVESERRVLAEALKYGVGRVSPEAALAELRSRADILHKEPEGGNGERLITTRAVLQEEQAVLRFAVEGKGTVVPLGAGRGGREGEPYEVGSLHAAQGLELNSKQRAAVEMLLTSRDRVMLLRGGAGTGKTTTLREAAAAIRHGGTRVFACAVTADASRGVLREVGFDRAETLEKLLRDPKLHKEVEGQVIWVDEAGMVGTPTMKRLFDLAEKTDARVVLSGDTKQHPPVERGDAMRLLERQAGIVPAEVDEIVRQTGTYKKAVEAIQDDRLVDCVELLDEMGAIKEMRPAAPEIDPLTGELNNPVNDRHAALADAYLSTIASNKSALVVSPTHAEGRAVTSMIRDRLKESGRLDADEQAFTRLQDTQWTEAQKADPYKYEVGQVVQFTQHVRGIAHRDIPPAAAGSRAKVVGVEASSNLVTIEDAAGHRRALPLDQADRFSVFGEQPLGLAKNDTIRITKECRSLDGRHRLTNGSLYRVAGFTEEGHIVLGNKGSWVVSKHAGHITHGYCTTPQAAQGRSVDVCLAAMGSEGMTASSLQQLYVILSRGKQSVQLLTDKRSSLIEAIGRVAPQRSATEMLRQPDETTRRDTSLLQHAREVQRLKAFEQNRRLGRAGVQRAMHPRQQDRQQQARQQQAGRSHDQRRGRDLGGRQR